jgi:hypothetical protein
MIPREDFGFLSGPGTGTAHVIDNGAKLLKGFRVNTAEQFAVYLLMIGREGVYCGTPFIGQREDQAPPIDRVSLLIQKPATYQFLGFHGHIGARCM